VSASLETPLGGPRWRRGSVASTVLFPIFYLAALGVGVGHLISVHTGLVQGQTYLHFIAPSLLATSTMQMGEGESLWPVLAALKWIRTYHAVAATPLEPEDILAGKLTWVATRAFATGVVYTIIIGCFGALHSWWSLTLPFLGALIALAFSAPLVAYVPLYHGVALARAAAFGQGSFAPVMGHLAVLVAMAVGGILWGRRTMRRRLVD
jgi:lipooligosaccharide transport system permease protein